MWAGEGQIMVVMLLTDPFVSKRRRCWYDIQNRERGRLTLALAVSGCASTVGVRALSAATHVDWCDWCLGKSWFGCEVVVDWSRLIA